MRIRFVPWLIVLVTLLAATVGLGFLLQAQDARTLSRVVLIVGQLLTYGWITLALFRWGHVGWVSRITRLLALTLVAAFLAISARTLNLPGLMTMVLGVYGMAAAFMLGLELLRLLLGWGHPVFGVAKTLLDEAIRMKLALIFVVGVVLFVPMLPFTLGGETRLQYRLESFLTYAMMLTTTLLSVMTILLAVRTVSSELTERQAFLSLTKPVSRPGYLLGKWLGIMSLNALLILVAGVGIYAFVQVLKQQPAMDPADRDAVTQQVLVARASVAPQPVDQSSLSINFADRLRDLRIRNPERFGDPNAPIEQITDAQRQQVQLETVREWLTLPVRGAQTYRFTGLLDAKQRGGTVQLRFEPKAGTAAGDNMLRLDLRVNDRPFSDARLAGYEGLQPVRNSTVHVAYIDAAQISDAGILDITIRNAGAELGQGTVSFDPQQGMQIYYRVGSFEGNLVRSLVVVWVRLGFLAVLGLTAATFLGFAVACLLCFLVFMAAVGSDYLAESLRSYAYLPGGEVPWWESITGTFGQFFTKLGEGAFYDAFKIIVRLVGESFTFLVPPLARYSPTPLLAYGKAVDMSMVFGVIWRIGLVSSGVLAAVACWTFSRREVARVTV